MIIRVDIDGTICENTNGDYEKAVPIIKNINQINSVYEKGHTIIYWTSRGITTGVDWTELTENQLKEWGCKYNKLEMKKPHYDLLIDDKVINSKNLKYIELNSNISNLK